MASQKCKECGQINKKLCECCENKCIIPLETSLLYCNFDKKVKKVRKATGNGTIKSVDCIRVSEDGTTILLEIKNQPPKNIEISEVAGKIKDTMLYLFNNNYELLQNSKIKFFLAIPEKKYTDDSLRMIGYNDAQDENIVFEELPEAVRECAAYLEGYKLGLEKSKTKKAK